jgi:hypothetical protein
MCPNCGEQLPNTIDTVGNAPSQSSSSDDRGLANPNPKQSVANIISILVVGLAGMFIGAITTFLLVGIIYLTVYGNEVSNSADCSRGMVVGLLSILGGAALGFLGGIKFASKNIDNKPVENHAANLGSDKNG